MCKFIVAAIVTVITIAISTIIPCLIGHLLQQPETRGYEFPIPVKEVQITQPVVQKIVELVKEEVKEVKVVKVIDPAIAAKKIVRKCLACHTLDDGGKTKIGPNLYNIVGKEKASTVGFKYSDALKAKGGVWSQEDLDSFLRKPKEFAAGTKMSFPGLKKEADRVILIEYLKTLK